MQVASPHQPVKGKIFPVGKTIPVINPVELPFHDFSYFTPLSDNKNRVKEDDLYRDQGLFSSIAQGDEAAFAGFYVLVKTDCSAYAYRVLQSHAAAQEVIQESLIRLWLHRDKLADVANPKAWFYRIVANECSRYLGKYGFKEERNQSYEGYYNDRPEVHQTENDISYRDTQRIIADVVASLPPQRQKIYRLSREEGLTHPEIALKLGVSRDYVKKALMAALEVIRQRLAEEGLIVPLIVFLLY